MTIYIIFGGIIALLSICVLASPTKATPAERTASLLAAQPTHQQTTINYGANPYRIGAYVYVMEGAQPSQQDWQGTYLGVNNGMAMVRDADSLVVAHVNKDQIFGAHK